MFQFHNGSIKIFYINHFIVSNDMFQFHNGSIKIAKRCSIKGPNVWFQFHNGSIKIPYGRYLVLEVTLVSIPQWFN